METGMKIIGRAVVETFKGDYHSYEEAIRAEGSPYEILFGENIALNVGMDQIMTFLCGGAGTVFSSANARLGIGNSTVAPVRTQTGLQAETVVDACEINWTPRANVTSALDSVIRQVGANSVRLSVADLFTTGVLASRGFASMNLSAFQFIRFWIRSSVARAAGNLRLLLDNTAGVVSPEETLSIPAIPADVWTEVTIPFANPTLLTAIISIGLDATVTPGASDIWLDDIKAVTTWYKGMDVGFPIFGTNQRASFRSTFAGGEANFSWREWGVSNGLAVPVNLNRGVADLGTKIAGQTRSLMADIVLVPV